MSNSSEGILVDNLPEFKAARSLWMVVSPVLIVVGTGSSCLSLAVLMRKKLRSVTTMLYLAVMSGLDILVLMTGLLRQWIKYTFDQDIRVIDVAVCKVHAYLLYVSISLNSWILVAVTIDRCIHVRFPFKASSLCSIGVARKTVMGLAIAMILVHFHMFFTVSYTHELKKEVCDYVGYFAYYIWPRISLCVSTILPFVIMFVCNVIIIRGLLASRTRIAGNVTNSSDISTSGMHRKKGVGKQNKVVIKSLTKTLLTVNCVFLLLVLPSRIYEVTAPYFLKSATEHTFARVELAYAIVYLLFYLNHSIHFFLYFLTSPKIVKELKCMFGKHKNQQPDQTGTMEINQ